jgi:hypothetical protein
MTFARPSPESQQERNAARKAANLRQLATPNRSISRGSYGGDLGGPVPKPEARYVDKALTDMAKDRPCLLMVPAICNHRTDTTVACHSNWAEHGGKGARRKADDTYTVWGCNACHYWLDFGKARAQDKESAFMLAHARQVLAWRLVALDASEPERFSAAVRRELERLNATPLGEAI